MEDGTATVTIESLPRRRATLSEEVIHLKIYYDAGVLPHNVDPKTQGEQLAAGERVGTCYENSIGSIDFAPTDDTGDGLSRKLRLVRAAGQYEGRSRDYVRVAVSQASS